MKWIRPFFLIFASIVGTSALIADTVDNSGDLEERDIQALREWIFTKRQVTVSEKGGALAISGEVRTEFQQTNEKVNGKNQRGRNGEIVNGDGDHLPSRGFDVEVNVMLDYRADRTWGSIKLEFDNDAGIFGGSLNKLKLERAFIGTRAMVGDTYTLDLVFGRNRMSSYFESKVEYGSFFDGILVRYDQGFPSIGDFYLHTGVFVVDERVDHYSYIAELGALNIGGTGLYSKFSVIDWDTKNYPDFKEVKGVKIPRRDNARFDFITGQWIWGYKFTPEKVKKTIIAYLAGLMNFVAKKRELTGHKKAEFGGYIGFSMGELRKRNDWSLDINYQVLAAQCVPDFDAFGIGLGNSSGGGLYTMQTNGGGGLTTRKTAQGNVNYRGFMVTLEYLITNNLNLFQVYQQAVTLDTDIGPFRRFNQYELELIYLF